MAIIGSFILLSATILMLRPDLRRVVSITIASSHPSFSILTGSMRSISHRNAARSTGAIPCIA